MEVIGAAASFIAIGQALIAGRHVVDVLRAIPGIGNELIWLNNEIETLRLAVEEAGMRGASTDKTMPETPLLKRARLQLTEVVEDLEKIRKYCVRAVEEDGKIKPKKTKWFLQQKQLSECRGKASDARANLFFALQTLHIQETKETKQIALRIESLSIDSHGGKTLEPQSLTGSQTSLCRLPLPQVPNENEPLRSENKSPVGQLTTNPERLLLPGAQVATPGKYSPVGLDSVTFNATLTMMGRCPRPCWCCCHASTPVSYKSPSWAQSLMGSFFMGCNRQVTFRNGAKCDKDDCKGNVRTSAIISYRFPVWVCSRFISLQACVDAFTGFRMTLRPVRVVPRDSALWGCLENRSREEVQQWMLHNGAVYPGDVDPYGDNLLMYVVELGTADVVNYLAQLWEDQLRIGNLDNSWFFDAYTLVEDDPDFLSEYNSQGLCKMISLYEPSIDAFQTPLHDAVLCSDMTEILQAAADYPWAINHRNYRGESPFHTAARLGNLDAIKEFLRLGCDIDHQNGLGHTALMGASILGHVHVVQYLLDAGCSVHAADSYGRSALYLTSRTVGEISSSVIKSLLSAGASTADRNQSARTVIHGLVENEWDKKSFKSKLQLFLAAGADLEAYDIYGETPFLRAIRLGNQAGLECLVESGAKITACNSMIRNVFHKAALHGNFATLSYLESLSLTGINTELVDSGQDTPWDSFIFVSYTEDWMLGSFRRPKPAEKDLFVRLYKGARDRNLELDIKRLQWVRQYLLQKDQRGGMAALDPLIKQKKEWKEWALVRTFKAIGVQIRERMWDAALESVDENIEVLQENIASSPWDNESYWDYLQVSTSEEMAHIAGISEPKECEGSTTSSDNDISGDA